MNLDVSLPEVDECVSNKGWRTEFPPKIERLYGLHSRKLRARSFDKLILPLLIIYNSYLAIDAFLLPGTWQISAFLHFAVVSPLILVLGRIYSYVESDAAKEAIEASLPLLVVAQIMFIFALNTSTGAEHYQYFAVMVMFFANVSQRKGHKVAVLTTLAMCLVYLAVLWPSDVSLQAKMAGSAMMLSAAYVTLLANRRFERDSRHSFLRGLQDKLRFQTVEEVAMNDPLTGAKNRRYLDEFRGQILPNARHGGNRLAALMLDIDHFKSYNDEYGHQAGDLCLKKVSAAIATAIRSGNDFVVRYGGEEFLIMMVGADIKIAAKTAERIRTSVEKLAIPHAQSAPSPVVTVSIGIAAGDTSPELLDLMIANADAALYLAKADGRNQVCSGVLKKLLSETPRKADDPNAWQSSASM